MLWVPFPPRWVSHDGGKLAGAEVCIFSFPLHLTLGLLWPQTFISVIVEQVLERG